MEKKQYDLVVQVLKRFEEHHILDKIVLIGSWCLPFYKSYFSNIHYTAPIRTRDIDFLIPLRAKFSHEASIPLMLRELGFVLTVDSISGNITLQHPEFSIEFLVPDIGRGLPHPHNIPELNINAQPLRYLSLLIDYVITVKVGALDVRVPNPAVFALHKLIISQRRTKKDKAEKDVREAMRVIQALTQVNETGFLVEVFQKLPIKWRKDILSTLNTNAEFKTIRLFNN